MAILPKTEANIPGGNYTVTITDGNGCVVVDTVDIVPTGIASVISEQVAVWPNPSNGLIEVKVPGSIPPTFTVWDALGRQLDITTTQNGTSQHRILLPETANGWYVLEIRIGESVVRQKIVVQ